MSKLDIPVYIISLDNKSHFDFNKNFNNVTFYNAIDARNKKPLDFYNQGIISTRVYYDLENGRKNHWGFAGIGGIGLYLTHRKLFQELFINNFLNLSSLRVSTTKFEKIRQCKTYLRK